MSVLEVASAVLVLMVSVPDPPAGLVSEASAEVVVGYVSLAEPVGTESVASTEEVVADPAGPVSSPQSSVLEAPSAGVVEVASAGTLVSRAEEVVADEIAAVEDSSWQKGQSNEAIVVGVPVNGLPNSSQGSSVEAVGIADETAPLL